MKHNSVPYIAPFYCTTVLQCHTFDHVFCYTVVIIQRFVVFVGRRVIVKRGFDSSSISRSGGSSGSSGSSGVHTVVGRM